MAVIKQSHAQHLPAHARTEHVPGEDWLWSTVAFAVVVSVLLHGVTATPAMARLDARRREAGRAQSGG